MYSGYICCSPCRSLIVSFLIVRQWFYVNSICPKYFDKVNHREVNHGEVNHGEVNRHAFFIEIMNHCVLFNFFRLFESRYSNCQIWMKLKSVKSRLSGYIFVSGRSRFRYRLYSLCISMTFFSQLPFSGDRFIVLISSHLSSVSHRVSSLCCSVTEVVSYLAI